MTTPRYPQGCQAGSQERGKASPDASDPQDYAWVVNFNYGNANIKHRDNHAYVRAVRSVSSPSSPRECQGTQGTGAPTFRALQDAWQRARRHKRPSCNQLAFESRWIDGLLGLEKRLIAGTWSPAPTMCFTAIAPKAREIHAPDFTDRVVHHWLVPQLEAIYESTFIADSYSNRRGKGTHAAVDRVHEHMRQVHSGQGGGWYLQLDIANFFNSIHRPTLYALLKQRMQRRGVPMATQRAVHALLRYPVARQGVHMRSTPAQRALVPRHKRLENAAPGCGIPIGNLSSQFFANAYLDRLDQFVKHELRATRYVRYVDDFVLVHKDKAQLLVWLDRIRVFLRDTLRLRLKAEVRLQPLSSGIDFLGYVVRPTHRLVRRRVVSHVRQSLYAWGRKHVRGQRIEATPITLRAVTATWRSYQGHFQHASTRRLQQQLQRRFPWLSSATNGRRRFPVGADHRPFSLPWQ